MQQMGVSGSIWKHLGIIWRHLEASGMYLEASGGIWEASGKHLGGIWKHLEASWRRVEHHFTPEVLISACSSCIRQGSDAAHAVNHKIFLGEFGAL